MNFLTQWRNDARAQWGDWEREGEKIVLAPDSANAVIRIPPTALLKKPIAPLRLRAFALKMRLSAFSQRRARRGYRRAGGYFVSLRGQGGFQRG